MPRDGDDAGDGTHVVPGIHVIEDHDDEGQGELVEFHSLRALVLPMYIPATLMHLARSLVIAVLPLHCFALGLSYDDVGLLAAVGGFGTVAGNVPAGKLVSARGPRVALMISAVLLAAGAALAVFASALEGHGALTVIMFGSSFLFTGLGDATGILSRQTFVGATVATGMRGRANSALGGTGRFGYTIGPLVGGLLAAAAGPAAVYCLQMVVCLAVCILICLFMPYVCSTQSVGVAGKVTSSLKKDQPAMSMVAVAREHWRVFLLVIPLCWSLQFMREARKLLFSIDGHSRDLSQDEIGHATALSYGIDAMLFPVAGWLLDNIGRTRTAGISCVGAAVASLFLLGRTYPFFIAFGVLSGMANGISAGVVLTLGSDLAPAASRGEFLAVFRTLLRSSDIAAPATLGLVANYFSTSRAELVVSCIGVAGALWSVCCVPETLQKDDSSPAASSVNDSMNAPGVAPVGLGKYHDLDRDAIENGEEDEEEALEALADEDDVYNDGAGPRLY